MADRDGDIAAPSALLLALEPRGLFSFARLIAAAPFLASGPRGARQAVVVLPGSGRPTARRRRSAPISNILVMRRMAEVGGATFGRRARTDRIDFSQCKDRWLR